MLSATIQRCDSLNFVLPNTPPTSHPPHRTLQTTARDNASHYGQLESAHPTATDNDKTPNSMRIRSRQALATLLRTECRTAALRSSKQAPSHEAVNANDARKT